MSDYKVELSEKDELVGKLREIVESMKSRMNKNNNGELAAFFEQQSIEKDIVISVINHIFFFLFKILLI